MATTDYDFNLTRNQIIESAYRKIGLLDSGQVLSGSQQVEGNLALNVVLKDWRNKGIFLWTHLKQTVNLVNADRDYTLGNDVLHIDKAYYTTSNTDIDVAVVTYREYLEITNKTSTSNTPECVALDYNVNTRTLWVYPTPSASLTLTILTVIRQKDMDTSSGTPEVPKEYLRALIYDLASDLADDARIDLRERGFLNNKADNLMAQNKKRDIDYSDENVVSGSFPTLRK